MLFRGSIGIFTDKGNSIVPLVAKPCLHRMGNLKVRVDGQVSLRLLTTRLFDIFPTIRMVWIELKCGVDYVMRILAIFLMMVHHLPGNAIVSIQL